MKKWSDIAREVRRRLSSYPHYNDALAAANALSTDYYFVGGKVFRTAAEILYNVDCGAKDADWDILSLDTAFDVLFILPGWNKTRGPGVASFVSVSSYSVSGKGNFANPIKRSFRFERPASIRIPKTKSACIDLVAIEDVNENDKTISAYFKAVPLDIQAIALDPAGDFVSSPGLVALENKKVEWNNPSNHSQSYMDEKLKTLKGFTAAVTKGAKPRHKCTCDNRLLFTKGCQCGGY